MSAYTKYDRGSEWRRWDLHIHTPETKKMTNLQEQPLTKSGQNT